MQKDLDELNLFEKTSKKALDNWINIYNRKLSLLLLDKIKKEKDKEIINIYIANLYKYLNNYH